MKKCGVKGCKKEAVYLGIIMKNINDPDARIEFNVCEEHSKYEWIIDNVKIQDVKS